MKELEIKNKEFKEKLASTSRQESLKKMKEKEGDVKELSKVFLQVSNLIKNI
jgi:hypothetical protein